MRSNGVSPDHQMVSSLGWRAHIDGIRAVAVLSVLFYHVGLSQVPGGFVGVDIFFVISGFLISKVIYKNITETGRFNFGDFYERRIRRIAPVYTIITMGCLIAGAFLFLPDHFKSLGNSSIWSAFFAANIYFYLHANYFTLPAQDQPLLHYWSLGVEEQFYIFFPVLVWGLTKAAPRLVGIFLMYGLVISLLGAQFYVYRDSQAAFYLPQWRAWELLTGSVLALPGFPLPKYRWIGEVASILGAVMVLYALLFFRQDMLFPGLNATLPVVGTTLILWGCERDATIVGRTLSLFPLRRIGLWSYSIYMVHWPLIVYSRAWLNPETNIASVLIVLASLIFGALSYRFIEQPFRRTKNSFNRQQTFLMTASLAFIIVGAGSAVLVTNGFADRLSPKVQEILAYDNYAAQWGSCFLDLDKSWKDLNAESCLHPAHPSVMLWGDSHMADISIPLRGLLNKEYPNISEVTASLCPPVVDFTVQSRPYCETINDHTMKWIEQARPNLVVLSALWPMDIPWKKFYKTVDNITSLGIPVIIFSEAPFFREAIPTLLAERELSGNYSLFDKSDLEHWGDQNDSILESYYRNNPMVHVVSIVKHLCSSSGCPIQLPDGTPVEFDQAHLTSEGAQMLVQSTTPDLLRAIQQFKERSH